MLTRDKKIDDMFIYFDRVHERYRRTDRRTDTAQRRRLHLRIASRGKNPQTWQNKAADRPTCDHIQLILARYFGYCPLVPISQSIAGRLTLRCSQESQNSGQQSNVYAASVYGVVKFRHFTMATAAIGLRTPWYLLSLDHDVLVLSGLVCTVREEMLIIMIIII